MTPESKKGRYERIYHQIKELTTGIENPVARMSTMVAILHHKIDYYFWTGFYCLDDGELIVNTYQGALACLKLKKNTGVCWASINQQKTIVVGNVHDFPCHIACSSLSASEIVVPLRNKSGKIVGVLDVDSKSLNSFDENDAQGLEKLVDLIYN